MATLKIRNKRTGEIKEIEASEAQDFGLDPEIALERFKAQSELEQAAGGKDITLSPDEQKKARGRADAERVVTLLEDKFFSGNQGKSIGYGKGQGISKNLELMTALGETISPELEDISSYRALRDSARPAFARAMGDVGNLSEPEQRAAIKNIPDIFQTRGQALAYFKDVRQKLGLPERSIEKQQQPVNLTQALLSGGLNIGQNPQQVPQTQAPQQSQNPLMQLLQRGQQGGHTNLEANFLGKLLFPRASEVQSRQNRGEQIGLGERVGVAGETAANILPFLGPGGLALRLGLSGATRGVTEPGADVGQRIVEGGKQGLMGLLLGKGGQAIPRVVTPARVGKKIRTEAVQAAEKAGLKFEGKNIIEAITNWAKIARQANPGKESQIMKILKGVRTEYSKKQVTPQQAKNIWDEVDSGFTRAGVSKTTVEASADQAMREVLRKELDKVAPGFEKGTKLIREGLQRGQFLRKAIFPTAIGAGVGVPLSIALSKILGQGRD